MFFSALLAASRCPKSRLLRNILSLDSVTILEVQDLQIRYGKNIVLDNVNFRIERPSLVAVIGPNGAGKTSLIRAIIGLVKPSKGKVLIFGQDITRKVARDVKARIGYVPQRDVINYATPITVRDVILSGLLEKVSPPRTVLSRNIDRKIEAISHELGIEDLLDRFFSDLSGGQQQRVLLARALVKDPDMLLLDEPLSNVDEVGKYEILRLLRNLVTSGKTVLLVTHDINIAIEWADYVLLVNKGRVRFYSARISEDMNKLKLHYPEEDRKILPGRSPYCA